MNKQICACGCGRSFEPRSGGIPQRYYSPQCANREGYRRNRDTINKRAKQRRVGHYQTDTTHSCPWVWLCLPDPTNGEIGMSPVNVIASIVSG